MCDCGAGDFGAVGLVNGHGRGSVVGANLAEWNGK